MLIQWLIIVVLFALTLRWGVILALKSEGKRAVVTWIMIGLWFLFGQVMLGSLCQQYPMFWIHRYVWMGPQYVLVINSIVNAFATLMSIVIFTVTVRY